MSNPFYYLVGLLVLSGYPLGIEPLQFAKQMIAPWVALGGIALYAGICWAVLARRPSQPVLAKIGLKVLGVALYAQLIFIFHFPLWVWSLGVEEDPLASSLLGLAPLFALFGVLALIQNRFEPHGGGLRFAFRSFVGLSLVPILFMLLLSELFERDELLMKQAFVYPVIAWVVVLGSLMLLMVVLPPVLRLVLGARPMEPGPLRDRLERMAEASGYRGARLFVVPTGTSRMANAFVAGLSARWRYIFFTEAIIRGMSPEELDCVLAHEVTHAKKRHIFIYLMASLAFSAFSGLLHEGLSAVNVPSAVIYALILTWAAVYWGLAFGYVSRRFETEADLVAARNVPALEGAPPPYGAARKMAAALERVADLNHAPPWAWSWRHFTIERRVDILLHSESEPAYGLAFERACDRFRTAALVLVAAGLLSGGLLIWIQRGEADKNRALLRAYDEVKEGGKALDARKYEDALEHLRKGIDGGSTSAVAWVWRADAERALGRTREAMVSEETARKKGITDPRLRLRAAP
jgi:Zn-dependent protease with chaperone function